MRAEKNRPRFSFAQSRLNPWRGLGGLPREVWLLFATNLVNRAGMMVLPWIAIGLGLVGLAFTCIGLFAPHAVHLM